MIAGMMRTGLFSYFDCIDCHGVLGTVQCPRCKLRFDNSPVITYTTQTDAWIACKDRMPEHDQKVIYYFDVVGMHFGKYDAESNTFYGSGGFLWNDVTHWMPAPKKPTL